MQPTHIYTRVNRDKDSKNSLNNKDKIRKFHVFTINSYICTAQKGFYKMKHPEWSYSAVLYEMNVRQLTSEGTLAAAAEYLPRLKELGIDCIWLMRLCLQVS